MAQQVLLFLFFRTKVKETEIMPMFYIFLVSQILKLEIDYMNLKYGESITKKVSLSQGFKT